MDIENPRTPIELITSLEERRGEKWIVTRLNGRPVVEWRSAVFTEQGLREAGGQQHEQVLDSLARMLAAQVRGDRPYWTKTRDQQA